MNQVLIKCREDSGIGRHTDCTEASLNVLVFFCKEDGVNQVSVGSADPGKTMQVSEGWGESRWRYVGVR